MTHRVRLTFFVLSFVALEILLMLFIDRPVSEYLRAVDQHHRSFINVFRAYTDLGKSQWYLWPAAAGILFCAIGVRLKSIAAVTRRTFQSVGEKLLFFFACLAVSGIVTDVIKPIVGRARPKLLESQGIYGFQPFSFHADWNGFPSGHSTTAFALATTLTILFPRGRIVFFIGAVILTVSRVMVNAHYVSDTLAGAAVGILSALVLRGLFNLNGMIHFKKCIFPIDTETNPR